MSGGYNEIGTHEMDPMIERVLLLKQEAFVYKIPPNQVSFYVCTNNKILAPLFQLEVSLCLQ